MQRKVVMWRILGAGIDLFHALAMGAWVLGMPLLFLRRWPRLRKGFATYAVAFIVLSQGSMVLLDECFLTTLSRAAWERAPATSASGEWFTVRLAYWIFGMSPSHRAISMAFEALVLVTAIGVLVTGLRRHAWVSIAAAVLVAGCGRQIMLPTPVTSATAPRVTACAFGVPTTRLEAIDVEGGIDVKATADEKYVQDVRMRATNQARVNGPDWRAGPGHFGEHRLDHDHGLRIWKLTTTIPNVQVSAEEIPGGTRIHLTTSDPRRVEELRGRLRDRVRFLGTKSCSF